MLALVITLSTIAYHLIMRLLVGTAFQHFMQNRADYHRRWYRVGKFESSVYKHLHVQKWKNKLPTYDTSAFDPKKHTWEEIVQAMCQAECVHETNIVLSFLPIFAVHWFGAAPVFIATSVCAAMIDLAFVIIQRYNRPRIVSLMQRLEKRQPPDLRES